MKRIIKIKTILSVKPIAEYKINDLINLDKNDTFFNYLEDFDKKKKILK
jgi:hypothetical protein